MNQEKQSKTNKILSIEQAGADVWKIAPTKQINTHFLEFLDWLTTEKHVKDKYQLKNWNWKITHLAANTNLDNQTEVANFIDKHQGSNNYKGSLQLCYIYYCQWKQIPFTPKKYKKEEKEIHLATKERIEKVIAATGKTMRLKLKISMTTGLRPAELHALKVADFDPQTGKLYPITLKHGAPRTLQLKPELVNELQAYIQTKNRKPNETIFQGNANCYGNRFREVRNRVAKQMNDPQMKTIRLYDLRHYFGTMLYDRTKDIKLTQYYMGHKHSNTTDIYVHLLSYEQNEEYTCKAATTQKEAIDLIEHGFQYVTTIDNVQLFKKHK